MTRILTALAALFALAACETVQGAGRDLQSAGRTIETESRQVQEDM